MSSPHASAHRAPLSGSPVPAGGPESRTSAGSASLGRHSGAPRALDGLRLIALFKFAKAVLLIATGYGVHLLLTGSLLERLRLWTETLTDSFAQRMLLQALTWASDLGAKRIHVVVAMTLGYTAIVLAEGIGLWMRRAWAEWLTILATASLIPFEVWELIVRAPNRKLAVLLTLLLNIVVLAYLVLIVRRATAASASTGVERC